MLMSIIGKVDYKYNTIQYTSVLQNCIHGQPFAIINEFSLDSLTMDVSLFLFRFRVQALSLFMRLLAALILFKWLPTDNFGHVLEIVCVLGPENHMAISVVSCY